MPDCFPELRAVPQLLLEYCERSVLARFRMHMHQQQVHREHGTTCAFFRDLPTSTSISSAFAIAAFAVSASSTSTRHAKHSTAQYWTSA